MLVHQEHWGYPGWEEGLDRGQGQVVDNEEPSESLPSIPAGVHLLYSQILLLDMTMPVQGQPVVRN
jgi:hypothetical protein